MPDNDNNGAVLEAIDKLEDGADSLKEAIDAHPDAALKAKLAENLPKLQAVIDNLNQQAGGGTATQ